MSGDRTVLEAAAQRAVDFEKGAGTWARMIAENTSSVLAARCRAYETLIGAGFTPEQTQMPAGSVVVVPAELLEDVVGDAEAYADAQYPKDQRDRYPTIADRYERDMQASRALRALMPAKETTPHAR